jgi:hypothetical protein
MSVPPGLRILEGIALRGGLRMDDVVADWVDSDSLVRTPNGIIRMDPIDWTLSWPGRGRGPIGPGITRVGVGTFGPEPRPERASWGPPPVHTFERASTRLSRAVPLADPIPARRAPDARVRWRSSSRRDRPSAPSADRAAVP